MRVLFVTLLFAVLIGSFDTLPYCAVHPPVAYMISDREGWRVPNSLVRRLNNPGALMFVHQHGAVGYHGYAKFTTEEDGWEALESDLAKKCRLKIPLHRGWSYL